MEAFVQRVVFKGAIGNNKQGTIKSNNRFSKPCGFQQWIGCEGRIEI